MALQFNELLGKPFAPAVQRELRRRRSERQDYETSPTLHNPYFKLKRRRRLSNSYSFSNEERSQDNIKFWELTALSKQGLEDLEQKLENGGNLKAPVGITDVSIEIKDYTFHTVEVSFVVPDINDWEAFKETWLIFGAPVEYEFGRKSLVSIQDNEDITPDKEVREGIIANFSWGMGEQNRTIEGTITIYSSTYVELTKMAHSADYDGNVITATFRDEMNKLLIRYSENIDNVRNFHGESGETPDFSSSGSNLLNAEFQKKSRFFYAVMERKEYKKRMNTWQSILKRMDRGESMDRGIHIRAWNVFNNSESMLSQNMVPFGVDIINTEKQDILSEIEQRLNFSDAPNREPEPQEYGLNSQEHINFINNNDPFVKSNGQNATDFRDWFQDQVDAGNVDNNLYERRGFSGIRETAQGFYAYGQDYLAYNNVNNFQQVLDSQVNNVSNTDIQKYALSQLSFENSNEDEFESGVYFYVSMAFVHEIINRLIEDDNDLKDEQLISGINLLDVRIRDLSLLGLGSSSPDQVVINPWNKTYVGGGNEEKFYQQNAKGNIKLLEDVFLSAPLILDIAGSADSPLDFVERCIDEIESATKGLLKLEKIEENDVENDKFIGKSITYFDASTITDVGNENAYHTFNLFDFREKIRDIDINSDLSDDFAEFAYFRSMDKVDSDNIFYYNNTYYNKDGTKAQGLGDLKNTYGSPDSYDSEDMRYLTNSILDPIFGSDNEHTSPLRSNNRDFEYEMYQYMLEGKEMINSYEKMFDGLLVSNKKRIENHLESKDFEEFEVDPTIVLLTYIEAYFTVITDIYHLVYNPFEKRDGTTTIPLKVDLTLDGIAGIVTGQVFKIDLSSFPMAYNISNRSPLFVVSTLNHNITGQNDWSTTIGGFLYIPASAQRDAIINSESLREVVDSKNARLDMIGDIFKEKIIEILEK